MREYVNYCSIHHYDFLIYWKIGETSFQPSQRTLSDVYNPYVGTNVPRRDIKNNIPLIILFEFISYQLCGSGTTIYNKMGLAQKPLFICQSKQGVTKILRSNSKDRAHPLLPVLCVNKILLSWLYISGYESLGSLLISYRQYMYTRLPSIIFNNKKGEKLKILLFGRISSISITSNFSVFSFFYYIWLPRFYISDNKSKTGKNENILHFTILKHLITLLRTSHIKPGKHTSWCLQLIRMYSEHPAEQQHQQCQYAIHVFHQQYYRVKWQLEMTNRHGRSRTTSGAIYMPPKTELITYTIFAQFNSYSKTFSDDTGYWILELWCDVDADDILFTVINKMKNKIN